jgi:small subunit ribosomal protein S10
MNKQHTKSIEIKLKSYCQISLSFYSNVLKTSLESQGFSISLITLPVKFKRFTLLRSPHVYKKAKEQFESRIHSVFLKITCDKSDNFLVQSKLKSLLLNKPKSILLKIKL